MNRLAHVLTLALASACAAAPDGAGLERFTFARPAMGTEFRIALFAPDATVARAAAERAFARIAQIEGELSDWDEGSELSRLCARAEDGPTPPVRASADLRRVLAHARSVSAATDGAFDVTVGPLMRLWRRSERQGTLPSDERLAAARAAVGWRDVEIDDDAGTVRLARRGMRLDLGGIAKGYALDEALAALRAEGVDRALVDGGGDVAASGPPPQMGGWIVAVGADEGELRQPRVRLELAHAAAATSGDAYRRVEVDGVAYSHVIDPRTGLGSTGRIAATAIAASGMEADAWASALCVLGAEGMPLVEARHGLEARVLDGKAPGGACVSSGFARMMLGR